MKKEDSISGIYVHFPFCVSKCAYCDFFSIPAGKREKIKNYLKNLNKYIEILSINYSIDFKKISPESIYIGGGTPSRMHIDEFEILFNHLKIFNFKQLKEFTIEINPDNAILDKIKILKKNKINRISIGVQSLQNNVLTLYKRNYTKRVMLEFLKKIKKEFPCINIDYIIGNKLEKKEQIIKNIKSLLPLCDSLSLYCLSLNKQSTLFKNKDAILMNQEELDDLYFSLIDFLRLNNFYQYEISNFAKKNKKSIHNYNYWMKKNYLGIGAGAVSCINRKRISFLKNFSYNFLTEHLTKVKEFNEILILGLRTNTGIDIELLNKDYKNYYNLIKKKINYYISKNILIKKNNKIKLNYKYFLVSNTILSDIII